jgi:hypothetical protein
VVRFTESAGRLGESTTESSDVPVGEDGAARIAVDASGGLYLALANALMVFAMDQHSATGAAPAVSATRSGVPGAVAIAGNLLWIGAAQEPPSARLQVTTVSGERRASVVLEDGLTAGVGIRSIAFTDATHGAMVTESPRTLYTFAITQRGGAIAMAATPVSMASFAPRAVATAPDGALLVATSDVSDSSLVRLLRLRPTASR